MFLYELMNAYGILMYFFNNDNDCALSFFQNFIIF